jgi:hypothetical protein
MRTATAPDNMHVAISKRPGCSDAFTRCVELLRKTGQAIWDAQANVASASKPGKHKQQLAVQQDRSPYLAVEMGGCAAAESVSG